MKLAEKKFRLDLTGTLDEMLPGETLHIPFDEVGYKVVQSTCYRLGRFKVIVDKPERITTVKKLEL